MTETEAALQAAIDANPLTGLRMILADHLDEIGDVRADGYRVLDLLGRWPTKWADGMIGYYGCQTVEYFSCTMAYLLPRPWRANWKAVRDTRKEADDEAARLWAELPEKSRREVLAMVKAG